MANLVANILVTDDLTVVLGLIAATLFFLKNLYKPQSLLHPILLGRQSEVGRVRNSRESATYRNFGIGSMGRLPVRPGKDILTLADFVRSDFEGPRTLWSTRLTNTELRDRISLFGIGLLNLIGLRHESRVLLMLNDGIEFIISDLALASHSIQSYTLSSASLFSHIFYSHPPNAVITHSEFLPQVLQVIQDAEDRSTSHFIVVVGEPPEEIVASVSGNVKVFRFHDVEKKGIGAGKIVSPSPKPEDVFTFSFFENEAGQIHGVQLTHANITAGVSATRALLPTSHVITPLDTIVSAHSLSTGYGRAVAYTAIYEGASFATLRSSKIYYVHERYANVDLIDAVSYKVFPIPPPTIMFFKPGHLESNIASISKEASKSWLLYPLAKRHKIAGIKEGHIAKDNLWDRLVFDGARARANGEDAGVAREVIISGGPLDSRSLGQARVLMSVHLINSFMHPLVAGPIMASHPHDLQDFSPLEGFDSLPAHVGPPSVNLEVKLVGVEDEAVERGSDPKGMILVRGPSVGKLFRSDDYVSVPSEDEQQGWVPTNVIAKVRKNGTFQLSM